MSKIELLTTEERAEAAAQGWGLFHVYDPKASRWRVQALGLQTPAAPETGALIVGLARQGMPLAIRALQLITESHK